MCDKMNAHNLLIELKLKRDSNGEVLTNFDNLTAQYLNIIKSPLNESNKSNFSLNVLCVLCKGLEEESWRSVISWDSLGVLAVSCCENVSNADLGTSGRPKYLACVYHLHRYLTQQKATRESILKLSELILIGEPVNVLPEYCKTYWAILMDKLIYIESLKNPKFIVNLMEKISENIRMVASVYNLIDFSRDNLGILLKKLYYLFHDAAPQKLNAMIADIFKDLASHKDISRDVMKTMKDKSVYDLYKKVLECFNVIIQVWTKCNFEDCPLAEAVKFLIILFSKNCDINHVLRTLYLDTFCHIFTKKPCPSYRFENVLQECICGMDKFEKLGYTYAAKETYPIAAQNIRLYLEHCVQITPRKMWIEIFTTKVLLAILNLIFFFMKKLPECTPHVKCDGCHLKGGLHDALRISCVARNLIMTSSQYDVQLDSLLPIMYEIVLEQRTIVNILIKDGCRNKEKCRTKIQTDAHNDAVALYKAKYLAYSNKLFEFYIENEIEKIDKTSMPDIGSLTRAFFNKGICELDMGLYKQALQCAFLGMALSSGNKGYDSTKFLSLAIEIKSKAVANVKDREDKIYEDEERDIQMESILDSCSCALKLKPYQGLKDILGQLCFIDLLLLELDAYRTRWAAILPLSGVCRSLNRHMSKVNGSKAWRACGFAALSIVTSAKSISCPHLQEMLEGSFPHLKTSTESPDASLEDCLLTSGCLLIMCDDFWQRGRDRGSTGDSAERLLSGRWTEDENCLSSLRESEQLIAGRNAAVYARKAFDSIRDGLLHTEKQMSLIKMWLRVAEMSAHGAYLHGSLGLAAQLLHTVTQFANFVDDVLTYLSSVGILLSWGRRDGALEPLLRRSAAVAMRATDEDNVEMEDVFMHYLLDVAEYYRHTDRENAGLTLLAVVQRREAKYRKAHSDSDYSSTSSSGRLSTAYPRLLQLVAWWWGVNTNMAAMDETSTNPVSTLTAHTVALRAQHQAVKSHAVGVSYTSRNLSSYRNGWRCCIAAGSAARAAGGAGCARRARAARATPLRAARAAGAASRAAKHLLEAARLDAEGEKIEECQVKLDSVRTILGLHPNKKCTDMTSGHVTKCEISKTQCSMDDVEMKECVESMLEVANNTNLQPSATTKLRQLGPNSPILDVANFTMPEFLSHQRQCECSACSGPDYLLLVLRLCSVESYLHLRSADFELAREYFAGLLKMLDFVCLKARHLIQNAATHYDETVLEIIEDYLTDGLLKLEAEILLDISLFRMSVQEYDISEIYMKKLFGLLNEMKFPNMYLVNDALLLARALKHHKDVLVKEFRDLKNAREIEQAKIDSEMLNVEKEMDNLKLSPTSESGKFSPKTPEFKANVPPKNSKVKIAVDDEQLPHVKRRIIKIDLDEKSPQKNDTDTKYKFFKTKGDSVQDLPEMERVIPEPNPIKKSSRSVTAKFLKKSGSIKSTKKESSIPTECTNKYLDLTTIPTKQAKKVLDITSIPKISSKTAETSNTETAGPSRRTIKSKIPEITSEKCSPILKRQPAKTKTVLSSLKSSSIETVLPQKTEPVKQTKTRTTRTDIERTDTTKSQTSKIAIKSATTKISSLSARPNVSSESHIPKRIATKQYPEISVSGLPKQDLAVNFVPEQSIKTYSRKLTLLKRATSPGKLEEPITPTKEVRPKFKPVKTTRATALRLEKLKLSPDTTEMKKTDDKMSLKTRRNK